MAYQFWMPFEGLKRVQVSLDSFQRSPTTWMYPSRAFIDENVAGVAGKFHRTISPKSVQTGETTQDTSMSGCGNHKFENPYKNHSLHAQRFHYVCILIYSKRP